MKNDKKKIYVDDERIGEVFEEQGRVDWRGRFFTVIEPIFSKKVSCWYANTTKEKSLTWC